MEFIDLKTQYRRYQEEIDLAIREVVESGQFILGKQVDQLESVLAKYVETKHCIGVSSGSCALLLALKALDVGPGDEVIISPFTWVSPIEAIRRVGAVPVFVDVDPDTCLINEKLIEAAITEKTKVILPISLFGGMPDLSIINEIANRHNLFVIEDGAQSFGSQQKGLKSCGNTTIGVASFFPTKTLGCYGDGGAVFTDNDTLAEKVRAMHTHGANTRYAHEYIGLNGRLDTIQAAVLLAKFPYFEQELKDRKRVAEYYSEKFSSSFNILKYREKTIPAHALYVLKSENRAEILKHMQRKNIPFAIYYPICVHEQEAYLDLGYKTGDFPEAELVAKQIFSIPMHPWLLESEMDEVIEVVHERVLEIV